MEESSVKKNQSVGRLLDIIELMAEHGDPIRINELAEKLEMSTATVYRFLITLVGRGYVKKDEENARYYLTWKLKSYSELIGGNTNIGAIAGPYLKGLAEKSGETASLVIMEDNMAVYISKYDGPNRLVGSLQRIGKRAPLYCTGVGKLFLADMIAEERDTLISTIEPLEKLTPNTIVEKQELFNEILKVKKDDISYDNEECEIGAKCIAAPIRDYNKRIIAAISISGPTTRMTDENFERIKVELVKVCAEISAIFGYC